MNQHRSLFACIAWLVIGSNASAGIPGDADGDADVDFDDFALMALCNLDPHNPAISVCQEIFDFDADTDLDVPDFAALQRCFSGPNKPASPDCAPHVVRIEGGCLHVIGTAASSALALRLQLGAPAILEVDVGNDGAADFSFDRSQFNCIVVHARGGGDVVQIDELNGVFTTTETTTFYGGDGNDTLVGGSGGETFVGGDGNDTVHMGGGADQFIWDAGDDTDVVNGGDGGDAVEINGSGSAEVFTVTANGARVRFDRVSPAPFFLDIGTVEALSLNANGGNDSLACTGNLAALIQITADGGAGDDTLLGSNGSDLLLGGEDNDFVDGQQGNDVMFLGAGDDTFQWDPGDGSDTVEGQAGHDIVMFNGSGGSEIFDFAANGPRLRFTRNLGNVVMDADDVERFDLRALGNTDTVTVNDLSGTDLTQANIDLAGTLGGGAGDGQSDNVVVNGTQSPDVIQVAASAGAVEVAGLAAFVRITRSEAVNDSLTVNGLGGADGITSGPGVAALIMLVVNQ